MKNCSVNQSTLKCPAQRPLLVVARSVVCGILFSLSAFGEGGVESIGITGGLFPPKPVGLTDCPTIGQPEIELGVHAEKLGGREATNLIAVQIAQLLSQSERFK